MTLAHDWGGIISLGWALEHREQVRGIVLTNTAVHQPADSRPPALIRLAHLPALRELVCVRTPVFLRGATALSWPPLEREVRAAFAAPYAAAARRRAIGDFVADIPFGADRPQPAGTGGHQHRHHRLARARAAAVGTARPGVRRAVPA